MAIIRCPHCGTANREGSNFCNSCGVELRAAGDPPQSPAPQQQAPTPPTESEPRQETSASFSPQTHPESAASPEPPISPSPSPAVRGEPWLDLDFLSESSAPPFEQEDDGVEPSDLTRILTEVPGLLVPVRITVSGEETGHQPLREDDPVGAQVDLWRRVRTHMTTAPLVAGLALPGARIPQPNLQMRGIFLLLGLAMLIPAIFYIAWPSGSATQWPGVQEAFDTVNGLPINADVLVYWAYDPAMAGELDLAALPVTTHLFRKRARMSVITLLPGGPATARRLINRARIEWQQSENLAAAATSTWTIPIVYLPGGPSILALLAQDRAAAFVDTGAPSAGLVDGRPDLSVVYAAQADDVQHWLEQVQPADNSQVVAVVAAGADPVLRAYLDSGQLAGLVSGFDGAYSYRQLLNEQNRSPSLRQLNMQIVLQDWGHFVFLLLIVFGNFIAVIRRVEEVRPE